MSTIKPAEHLNVDRDIVWNEIHYKSTLPNSINLGHGAPEDGIHEGILKTLSEICSVDEKYNDLHQYSLIHGYPRLVQALGKFYSPDFGRELCTKSEIMVSVGASFILHCAVHGIINPGDEVIIIEPFYEQYPFTVEMARGKPVFVPMKPPKSEGGCPSSADWTLDIKDVESKITSRSKMIILNNPHNPTGKVFTREELEPIADLAKKHNLVVLMDEVYEFLIYDGKHVKMATLPGMWERTITVGSAGKMFDVTGWRLGWAVAAPHLIKCMILVHQDSVRTSQTVLQHAVAVGLEMEIPLKNTKDSYWKKRVESLRKKRDRLVQFLSSVGMGPNIPEGSYFITANVSELVSKIDLTDEGDTKDFKFFRWLFRTQKVVCVPMSMFYSEQNKHLGVDLVRFCYTKKDSTLKKAEDVLLKIREEYFPPSANHV